jgi:FtsH-binding integral membrane protein
MKLSQTVALTSWFFITFILSGYVTEFLIPNLVNGLVLAFFVVTGIFFGLMSVVVRKPEKP